MTPILVADYIKEARRIEPDTRLRRALQLRSLSLVKRIISSNPQATGLVQNVDFEDHCNTSLHIAAILGLPEIAEYLLQQGHEDQGISRNAEGVTPLMFAAQAGTEINEKAAAGRLTVARMLIGRFPTLTAIRDKEGMTAFSYAARHGSVTLLSLFLSLPPPPDLLPPQSDEENSDEDEEDEASKLSAPDHPWISTRDEAGNTPLHHASAAGHLKVVRLLLEAGADAQAQNDQSWTPKDYSASVQAEVYLRNLAKERETTRELERGIAEGAVNITRNRGPSDVTRGAVRLVRSNSGVGSDDSDDDDEDETLNKARSRAGT